MDPLLVPFLTSPDGPAADDRLGDLLQQHATPLIRRIISRRLARPAPETEDLCAQIVLQLLVRLRQEKADARLEAIDGFTSYVAATARHGCDHYIRAQYPLRWRLRSRILYVLEHDSAFAAWKTDEGTWGCGLAGWQSLASGTPPGAAELAGTAAGDVRGLLRRAFDVSAAPLNLSDVVDVAAAVWNIPWRRFADEVHVDRLAHQGPGADEAIEQRERVAGVWARIRDLPVRQRHALLLNMRDDALSLFLTTGAAGLRDIAGALELPAEEFAALWNDLPLADNAIAVRLGCTRQQVINLRMAARKRLGRGLADAS
jgi:hypothetical protein